jgi:glycogen debranching enzyme
VDGFFYYLDKRDNDFTYAAADDLKRQEIVGFFPLWAGIASTEQASRLVGHLQNPAKFGRPFGLPSLAADDPYYNPKGYWNGPVWIELNYLVFRGLLDYGYHELAREMAVRIFANIIHHLKTDHSFWEFYSPDELWGGYHQTYVWTGIVARMLIDLDGR